MQRVFGNVIKACVLLAIVFAIYRLWRAVPALTAAPDDDDITVQPVVTVHVGTVTRATLHAYRELDAVVEPQPARGLQTSAASLVSSQTVGVAAAVFCKEGQHVEIGQPLLALDDRSNQVTIAHARAVLAAATAAQSSTATAVKAGNVPPRDALRADLARTTAEADLSAALAREDVLNITSPIAGTVVRLNAAAGQAVGPGIVSVEVIDFDRLTTAATAPGWVLQSIAVGDRVEVSNGASSNTGAMPATKSTATYATADAGASQQSMVIAAVTSIDPSVDPATGLGQIDVNMPAGSRLVPGQTVHLHIITAEHKDVLTVPSESVAEDATGRPSISGIERDFRWAIRHPVTVGLHDGGRVEISGDGIHEGLDVVTTGAQALPDETHIEVVR